jgi:hypothetical protein
MDSLTYEEALQAVQSFIGREVRVSVGQAAESGSVIAAFDGTLERAKEVPGLLPSDAETIALGVRSGGPTPCLVFLWKDAFEGAWKGHTEGRETLTILQGRVEVTLFGPPTR